MQKDVSVMGFGLDNPAQGRAIDDNKRLLITNNKEPVHRENIWLMCMELWYLNSTDLCLMMPEGKVAFDALTGKPEVEQAKRSTIRNQRNV